MDFKPSLNPLRKEVRLAVVMYGGISLCVYMNGITDQLWHLVRATARKRDDAEGFVIATQNLQPIERVYRRLAQICSNVDEDNPNQLCAPDAPIDVRFVIDVLSGTSAGGLNSLFLAKALSCEQDPSSLTNLWIREGDMTTLLNDSQSVDKVVPVEDPPEALLNSRRIAQRLLEALRGMSDDNDVQEGIAPPPGRSKLVERLDLFMTATDLKGLDLSLDLESDENITELRHKNVFHFVHDPNDAAVFANKSGEVNSDVGRNDFIDRAVPFLAFVSRATSCIAPAFEPMQLNDIASLVDPKPAFAYDPQTSPSLFAPFYRDYWSNSQVAASVDKWVRQNPNKREQKASQMLDAQKSNQEAFAFRSFGDGGYGNNYPFNWAIDTILTRTAELKVDRKLLYVEPDPTLEAPLSGGLENSIGAARMTIFQHLAAMANVKIDQPIRDQVDRIHEQNRLLNHVNEIKQGIQEPPQGSRIQPSGPLLHLRASATTDDLANLIAKALGFEASSPYWEALRYLARTLREYYLSPDSSEETQDLGTFLHQFDLGFRLRRLQFLADQIRTEINGLDKSQIDYAADLSRYRNLRKRLSDARNWVFLWQSHLVLDRSVRFEDFVLRAGQQPVSRNHKENPDRFRCEGLASQYERAARGPAAPNFEPIFTAILEINLTTEDLREIIDNNPTETQRIEAARKLLSGDRRSAADSFIEALRAAIQTIITFLDSEIDQIEPGLPPTPGAGRFEWFKATDAWMFPALYATGTPESEHIDVIRVSPLDCDTLVSNKTLAKQKLAGTGLGHFSGFFHPAWRGEDVIWGRLDGAERLITSMLPNASFERSVLIAQAQLAILYSDDVDTAVKEAVSLLRFDDLLQSQSMESFRATRLEEVVKSFAKARKKHSTTVTRNVRSDVDQLLDAGTTQTTTFNVEVLTALVNYAGVL